MSQENPTGPARPPGNEHAPELNGSKFTWKHVVATFFVVSSVAAVLVTWLEVRGTGDAIARGLASAFVTTNVTTIHSAISNISKEPKLVVLTPEVM